VLDSCYDIRELTVIWPSCWSCDDSIVHPTSLFVKLWSQATQEHCPKKLSEASAQAPVDAIMQAAQGGSIMDKQPHSRMCFAMCFACGIDPPLGRHRPAPRLLHRRRRPLHRSLPAQAGTQGLSRPTARGNHIVPTGRTNSNSFTRYRSLGMTEYYRARERQEAGSVL
jgi:hypothetical protein